MTNPMNSLGNTAGGEQVEIANATSTNASLVSNLQATITPYFDVEFDEKDPSADEHIKNMVLHNMADNEQLHQAHIILMEKNGKGARLFEGIDKCYLLLQNSPDEKIVLLSMFPLSMVKSYLQGTS
jgi:hypothetical protein